MSLTCFREGILVKQNITLSLPMDVLKGERHGGRAGDL